VIVADTDVLIDFAAGREPAADAVAQAIRRGRLATTAITRFELRLGMAGSSHRSRVLEDLLGVLPVYALDAEAADRAAAVRRDLQAKGDDIGMADSLIAGVVLRHGGELLTRNLRHYRRVEGLRLVELGTG
jgi:tRNA(fMet)-specific endonuclease VapC